MKSGRASEQAAYLARPRILLELELEGLSLGKAAEACGVDVPLVHKHLEDKETSHWRSCAKCSAPGTPRRQCQASAIVPRMPRSFATCPTHIAILVVNGDEAKALLAVEPLACPSQQVVGPRAKRCAHRREHGRLARPHLERVSQHSRLATRRERKTRGTMRNGATSLPTRSASLPRILRDRASASPSTRAAPSPRQQRYSSTRRASPPYQPLGGPTPLPQHT